MGRRHGLQPAASRLPKRKQQWRTRLFPLGHVNHPFPIPSLRPLNALTPTRSGHVTPQTYTQATYTVFKTGTKINSTHWQVTAKCTGCTSWTGKSGSKQNVKIKGDSRFGWAYSLKKPSNPNSATSAIPVHDLGQYFSLDVSKGGNKDFAGVVAKLT